LSLHKSLWEDPLGLLQMVDEETLLVYVVAIVRLYVVLDGFLLQDSKILPNVNVPEIGQYRRSDSPAR
jgi:hypothetical protein